MESCSPVETQFILCSSLWDTLHIFSYFLVMIFSLCLMFYYGYRSDKTVPLYKFLFVSFKNYLNIVQSVLFIYYYKIKRMSKFWVFMRWMPSSNRLIYKAKIITRMPLHVSRSLKDKFFKKRK